MTVAKAGRWARINRLAEPDELAGYRQPMTSKPSMTKPTSAFCVVVGV